MNGYIIESLAVIFSSSGLIGGVIAAILKRTMKKASEDASKRREEYLEEQLARYELDQATSRLLVTLARFSRRLCTESELEIAESNYTSAVNKSDMLMKKRCITDNKKYSSLL